jgi:(2Fe-2S) ferredoxin
VIAELHPIDPVDAGQPVELIVCVNDGTPGRFHLSCSRRGSLDVERALTAECARRGGRIAVRTVRCLGMCGRGPNLRLKPGKSSFHAVAPADVGPLLDLVEAHCAALLGHDPGGG